MAVNFAKVDGTSMTIQEAFPYSVGMKKGNIENGDKIQVQKAVGDGYDIYYLSDGWFSGRTGSQYYADRDGKWFTGVKTTPADAVLAPGQAFWYLSKNYETPFNVTVAGSVITDVSKEVTINKEWAHIANPYPVALDLNTDIGYQEGMRKGNIENGDKIQIPKVGADGYDIYYLSDGWFSGRTGSQYYADRDGKWFTGVKTTPAVASIPVGMGAWYKRNGDADFTITIANPVK